MKFYLLLAWVRISTLASVGFGATLVVEYVIFNHPGDLSRGDQKLTGDETVVLTHHLNWFGLG